jgi:hypothetical protein
MNEARHGSCVCFVEMLTVACEFLIKDLLLCRAKVCYLHFLPIWCIMLVSRLRVCS